jgi:uncharacterized protein (DUF2249 family)
METKIPQDQEPIDWHPAFFRAIQMELDEYGQDLEFISEHQLTTKPLRIDVVIIRKSGDVPIKKNIAAIFRKINIVEYKSPSDYISVKDFYKVYGYACLYQFINKEDIEDLTLTFVGSHYPRKLLTHLQEVRGYTVEEKWPGVYIVKGDVMSIQIIDSRKLSSEENLWLKSLRKELDKTAISKAIEERERQSKSVNYDAYFDVIFRANPEVFKEVMEMRRAPSLLQLVLETEAGASWFEEVRAKGKAEGKAEGRTVGMTEGRTEVARNALAQGASPDFVQKITGLDMQTITALR